MFNVLINIDVSKVEKKLYYGDLRNMARWDFFQ